MSTDSRKCVVLPRIQILSILKFPTLCGNFQLNELILWTVFLVNGMIKQFRKKRIFWEEYLKILPRSLFAYLINFLLCLFFQYHNLPTFPKTFPRNPDPRIPTNLDSEWVMQNSACTKWFKANPFMCTYWLVLQVHRRYQELAPSF